MLVNNLLVDYEKELKDFHRRVEDEVTILLYHGVTDVESRGIENQNRKHIPKAEFLGHMRYLRESCHPISIDDYLTAMRSGEPLPPRSVIVSFDDGFRNNFTVAAPILAETGVPAVFYISSGIVNTTLMFWVDILEDCLNSTEKRSVTVRLETDVDLPLVTDVEKLYALGRIKAYCKASSATEKDRVLQAVQDATGVEASVDHSPNYGKITWDELRQMHSNPLFTIGGHSLYHNILAALDDSLLEKEIGASLDLLEINLGSPVRHYSYPEGQANHYNGKVIRLLMKKGVVCSPSAMQGLNSMKSDPFHLRRIMVGFNGIPFPFWDRSI